VKPEHYRDLLEWLAESLGVSLPRDASITETDARMSELAGIHVRPRWRKSPRLRFYFAADLPGDVLVHCAAHEIAHLRQGECGHWRALLQIPDCSVDFRAYFNHPAEVEARCVAAVAEAALFGRELRDFNAPMPEWR
jgi:hypothetical protein